MKVAVISDAHLFQSFTKNYDSIKDFERSLENIKDTVDPDLLLLAGDMFDYKKTETVYLTHYEGEGYMLRIRNILKAFQKPIYAIRGNHEKEEVLRGLEQTVSNFHFKKGVQKLGDLLICFMDTFYETGGYSKTALDSIERFIYDAIKGGKNDVKNRGVLLCHESFPPYANPIPSEIISSMSKKFRLVLNGHMHEWIQKVSGFNNVYCVPSLLPSRIVKGKYASLFYEWKSDKANYEIKENRSPFGYVSFDTAEFEPSFHEYIPLKKIVEVRIDVSSLRLDQARERLRLVYSELNNDKSRESLIILPVIQGNSTFSALYLENVRDDFPDLAIENIRDETVPVASIKGQVLAPPALSVQDVREKLQSMTTSIIKELRKEGVEIREELLKQIINDMFDNEILIEAQKKPQVMSRLRTILEPIVDTILNEENYQKPDNLKDLISVILREVR